jgi:hypothetical protein
MASVREEMVANAIEFLQDSRVVSSPEDKKRKYELHSLLLNSSTRFLTSRGMTEEEINEAFRRGSYRLGTLRAHVFQWVKSLLNHQRHKAFLYHNREGRYNNRCKCNSPDTTNLLLDTTHLSRYLLCQ